MSPSFVATLLSHYKTPKTPCGKGGILIFSPK
jgi:hypothetical protein